MEREIELTLPASLDNLSALLFALRDVVQKSDWAGFDAKRLSYLEALEAVLLPGACLRFRLIVLIRSWHRRPRSQSRAVGNTRRRDG